MNHYRRLVTPKGTMIGCGGMLPAGQTADASQPITCPHCIERLAAKASAEAKNAQSFKAGSQEQRFHSATAAHYADLISRPAT